MAPTAAGQRSPRTGADGNHDEDHLEAFEQDRLEGRDARNPVRRFRPAGCLFTDVSALAFERRSFIVEGHYASGSQHRLAQPAEAEKKKQNANDELEALATARCREGSPTQRR